MSKHFFLRRKGYGFTSCAGIAAAMIAADPDMDIDVVRADQGIPTTDGFVIRWGTTSNVPGVEKTIVNPALGIHRVYNKGDFRMLCAEEEIAPRSWRTYSDFVNFYLPACDDPEIPELIPNMFPWMVVRKNFHKQGKNLHLCKSLIELEAACQKYDDYYISAYVPKVSEYRALVMQGRILYIYEKKPGNPGDVAWNHSNGGSITNVKWGSWPIDVAMVATRAFKLSGLDFAAIDVMVDINGKAYVLEANTAPETTGPYNQSCFAKGLNWMINNGKAKMPVVHDRGWKGYIHPAMTTAAILED